MYIFKAHTNRISDCKRADVSKIYDYCLLKDNFLPIQDYISQKELMKSNESMQ